VERTGVNLRFQLRAYEYSNSSRLAIIVIELGSVTVERAVVIERWRELYPRHAAVLTGKNSIRGRISKALTYQRAAGIVKADETTITVLDADLLAMVASNLPILVSDNGVSLPPTMWRGRPDAPEHLKPIQAELIARIEANRHE